LALANCEINWFKNKADLLEDVHYNKAYEEGAKRRHGVDPGHAGDDNEVFAVEDKTLAVVGAVLGGNS
jgi:hypothetical protein